MGQISCSETSVEITTTSWVIGQKGGVLCGSQMVIRHYTIHGSELVGNFPYTSYVAEGRISYNLKQPGTACGNIGKKKCCRRG